MTLRKLPDVVAWFVNIRTYKVIFSVVSYQKLIRSTHNIIFKSKNPCANVSWMFLASQIQKLMRGEPPVRRRLSFVGSTRLDFNGLSFTGENWKICCFPLYTQWMKCGNWRPQPVDAESRQPPWASWWFCTCLWWLWNSPPTTCQGQHGLFGNSVDN